MDTVDLNPQDWRDLAVICDSYLAASQWALRDEERNPEIMRRRALCEHICGY